MLDRIEVWQDALYQELKQSLHKDQVENSSEWIYNTKDGSPIYGPLSDRLEEIGAIDFANHVRDGYKEPEGMDDSWRNPFAYAGDGRGWTTNSEVCVQAVPPGLEMWCGPFCTGDVRTIHRIEEGENDGAKWIIVGQLWDERFFCLRAGCDYTGWG